MFVSGKTQFRMLFPFIPGEMKGICMLGDKLLDQHDISFLSNGIYETLCHNFSAPDVR